jgi:hypothetical protein
MPAAQYEPKFTDPEAQRFAALWAGFETGNLSEAEAMGKGRIVRRMFAAKGLRIIDALELPEIRKAIDDQLQPVRAANSDTAAQAEVEELRGKLAVVVPKVRELTEALTREKELTAQLRGQSHPAQHGAVGNGAGSTVTSPSLGAQSWLFEIAVVVTALVLMVVAAFR